MSKRLDEKPGITTYALADGIRHAFTHGTKWGVNKVKSKIFPAKVRRCREAEQAERQNRRRGGEAKDEEVEAEDGEGDQAR